MGGWGEAELTLPDGVGLPLCVCPYAAGDKGAGSPRGPPLFCSGFMGLRTSQRPDPQHFVPAVPVCRLGRRPCWICVAALAVSDVTPRKGSEKNCAWFLSVPAGERRLRGSRGTR